MLIYQGRFGHILTSEICRGLYKALCVESVIEVTMNPESNSPKPDKQFCNVCNITLATKKTFQVHLRTRKHQKRCGGLPRKADSISTFRHVFGDRLFDITSPGIITMDEAFPWLDLLRSDVETLVKKIFPPRLHWSVTVPHPGMSLDEFKMLLIAARTGASERAFQHMKDVRAENAQQKAYVHKEAMAQLESAWKRALYI